MRPVSSLPPVFAQYRDAGGVLHFALFEESDGADVDVITAIRTAIPAEFLLDVTRLLDIGSYDVPLEGFLGDWCSAASGNLIRRGTWYAQDGREFTDPELTALEGVPGDGGVFFPPDAGSGGQFAYAFLCPPGEGLKASPLEVQAMFDALRAEVFPAGQELVIQDWSSPDLREASPYFASGYDQWGIFLFTVYQPQTGRLVAIAGAAAF